MRDNPLEQMDIKESEKAFIVLMLREIANNPNFQFGPPAQGKEEALNDGRACFKKTLNEIANDYDWAPIESTFVGWGKYGWITDLAIAPVDFWDELPDSQEVADQKVMAKIDDRFLHGLIKYIEEKTSNMAMFEEACLCFGHQFYIACASLLTSLIDGVLISCYSNGNGKNRKTGEGAGTKLIEKLYEDDFLGLPGYANLEIKNYKSFLSTIFARANGFENEPVGFNRNYFHHGMSKRTISLEDCIKLFIAYRQTIRFSELEETEG